MKRKLIKQGIKALTVTLPSDWIENNNLKQGDELELMEEENSIRILTEKTTPVKEITVDVSGLLPRLADRFMARAYQKGYDKITIKFNNQDLKYAIENKVSELIGYEILNVGTDYIEIYAISSKIDIDFDQMLRRGFLTLLEMAQTCHDAWIKEDKKSLENITLQDISVNKFLYYCLRHLNKSAKTVSFGMSILYYLIESLEDLGDELKVLGKTLTNIKPKPDILNIIKKMNEMFRVSYEYYYKPERNKVVRAFLLSKEIKAMIEKSLKTSKPEEIKALISIDFSIRIIYHITTMRLDTLKELSG